MDLTSYISAPERKASLAAAIGANPNYLYQVATGRRRASEALALSIESATSGAVTCEELRPDLRWERDDLGRVTGYRVPLAPPYSRSEATAGTEH